MMTQKIHIPPALSFTREFREAPELEALAQTLIRQHAELAFLMDWDIRVLWKRESSASSGKEIAGRCRVLTGELAFFAKADWLIWCAADIARENEFGDHELEALVFHELLHCALRGKEGEEKPGIVGHDFEAFGLEVERYGAWHPALVRAKAAFRQLELGLVVPPPPGRARRLGIGAPAVARAAQRDHHGRGRGSDP